MKNRDAQPGGWAFEFRNDWFPDVDDTAFVLMAMARVAHPDSERIDDVDPARDWPGCSACRIAMVDGALSIAITISSF